MTLWRTYNRRWRGHGESGRATNPVAGSAGPRGRRCRRKMSRRPVLMAVVAGVVAGFLLALAYLALR
jgi:hypothetical protein